MEKRGVISGSVSQHPRETRAKNFISPQYHLNFPHHPLALNSYLMRLIFSALGPLLLFSIFMMVLFARQEQANRRKGLESTARALSLAIDQEVRFSLTNLEALARSEPLDVGALSDFRTSAKRFLETQDSWKSLTLFDPQGTRLAHIAKPLAAEVTSISPATLDGVKRTRLPMISDFPNVDARDSGITIHVPVVRENAIVYVLGAAIEPTIFTEILARQEIPKDWVGSVYDSKQIVIARSRDAGKLVGTPVDPLLQQTDASADEQFLHGITAGGISAYALVSRSPLTGWYFALTVPSSEVNAILYRSLAIVGGGGLALFFIGLASAWAFARRASASLKELSVAAHDLGRGQAVHFPADSPIAELDTLVTEMERAAHLLREREDERDRVEAALRKQEESLRRQADLLDVANEAIFARQLDSRIIYWNRGAEQLYGYSQEEAIGVSSRLLLATEFPKGWDHFGAALLKAGQWSGELRQKTKHGRCIDVESRFKVIHDREGNHVILECNRDITQRKQAVRRLATEHQVTLALAESESPETAWGKILEILVSGLDWDAGIFWMVDKKNQLLECLRTWHSSAQKLSFCPDRPALTRGMGLPGRVWQNETPVWVPDFGKEAKTPELSENNVRAAFAFPIKLGGEILGVIELFSSAVRAPDPDLLKTAQVIGDEIGQFAERMRAEAALRRSEEHLRTQAQELEQQLLASGRLVAVGELTASMAHEFNNPLGIILGFAQGLLDSIDPNDPNYHHVQIIAEEAKRCENLVQELLEFGRPKSADFVRTDVVQIIRRTISLVQPHAAKSHVETTVDVDDELPNMYADTQQLQQVLLNLSLNAVDAMPKGGTLAVGANYDSAEIVITVSDSGLGIDPEVLPRIFQPFFTSKKRRGLGLGLPICDRIVKAHGGRIEVDSRPGHGTTFAIHLPLIPPSAAEIAQQASSPDAAQSHH